MNMPVSPGATEPIRVRRVDGHRPKDAGGIFMKNVIMLIGSARTGSINATLGRAIARRAQGRVQIAQHSLAALPMYNEDLWTSPPAAVLALKAAVSAADAVVLVTPEYNRSVPALLKNALDWGSRPYGESCWHGKPCGIIGASPSPTGTVTAQSHLRAICGALGMHPVAGQPEYLIQFHPEQFGPEDSIVDDGLGKMVDGFIDRLVSQIALFSSASE